VSPPARQTPQRLLLRCELSLGGSFLVTNTVEVGETEIRVVSSLPAEIGDEAGLVLSLPGLVPPLHFGSRVQAIDPANDHQGPSILCTVSDASPEAREMLAQLTAGKIVRTRGQYRCLLIEDSAFVRDLFAYGVQRFERDRKAPVRVEIAEDADRAWHMLENERYDMAIVDHYLPTLTGADLIAKIRRDARMHDMSIVAISVGGSEAREATLAAGADMFLDKPIVLKDLFATLDRLTPEATT
jgi:CheY-like chemotaxis protein